MKNLAINVLAFMIMFGTLLLFSWGSVEMTESIKFLKSEPISLEYHNLIEYSLQTFLRMFFAMMVSIVFTLAYGTLAAKNRYAEQILIPLLDILQSVPILGFISFTITFFLSLAPGNVLGAELAAIFAIFTSQVWNMTFSFYHSLKNIPKDLLEVANLIKLSKWQRFWKMEVPYAIPNLVWNMVVSISGGWFFVVAAEVVCVGNVKIELQGIGSYIALATEQNNTMAILHAILAMIITIVIYDQLLIKPIITWSDKFCYDANASKPAPSSWALSIYRRSFILHLIKYLVKHIFIAIDFIFKPFIKLIINKKENDHPAINLKAKECSKKNDYIWYTLLIILGTYASFYIFDYLNNIIGIFELLHVIELSFITFFRIVVMLIIVSIIWIPIGIYIGLRPKLSNFLQPIIQLLSAFPANLLFPIFGILITKNNLDPNIWLTPLIIMGSQWYILYNVIGGASNFSNDLQEVCKMHKIKGIKYYTTILIPAIFPSFLVGAITASCAAWNASIVAEIITFKDQQIVANGIGSYIAQMTISGDIHRVILGIGVMSIIVIVLNRFFWKPVSEYVNNKYL